MSAPRYGYLGPAGTFAGMALQSLPEAAGAELVPLESVVKTLAAVQCGEVDGGVVPIENSVEGSVAATLDELARGGGLLVRRECVVPVTFSLLVRPGTTLDQVDRVATHPHAEAQCRGWVGTHLPRAHLIPALSTASAAAELAAGGAPYQAAIASPLAGREYGLVSLADDIEDNPGAETRFVLVTRPGALPLPTGYDKTSLVAYMREDHPGALLEILTEFAVRGVNLTRIESRPTREGLGSYCFSIDCEGHVDDARVGEALIGLRRVCADVRFLGSYERSDRVPPKIRFGTSDAEFRDAQAWLASIREGR